MDGKGKVKEWRNEVKERISGNGWKKRVDGRAGGQNWSMERKGEVKENKQVIKRNKTKEF